MWFHWISEEEEEEDEEEEEEEEGKNWKDFSHARRQDGSADFEGRSSAACGEPKARPVAPIETFARSWLAAISSIFMIFMDFMDFMRFHVISWDFMDFMNFMNFEGPNPGGLWGT